ncbi:coth protein-domain-containing protein [Parasitella parasitica]|nr:coth protein-domain-containing protein [Parasitella parasitica]
MKLNKLVPLQVSILASLVLAQNNNITYNVIASPASPDMSVAVIVDNGTYHLTASTSGNLLYSGRAPAAQTAYHYVILDSANQVSASDAFFRPPIQNETTTNEFFNRSLATHQIEYLPQVYEPVPALNRIKSNLHILNQIPTIQIWGNQTAIDILHKNQFQDLEFELNVTYYGLNDVQEFQNVKVSLSGRSSRWIPKLSYGLKMKTNGNQSLFGYKKLKLRALGMDPSYVRECVSYSTLKSVGIPASGFSYVRLFINKQSAGLYGLIETFQDPWTANVFAGGDISYKPGYLYQGQLASENQTVPVFSDLSYYGENTTLYSLGQYKIKAGTEKDETPDDFKELQEFTQFINSTSSDTTVEEWEKHLDTEIFTRAMAIEDLLGFSDAYMTLLNNFYVYNDPKSPGRYIYIPADLDTTIGTALYELEYLLSGNYSEHPGFNIRPLTSKLFSNQIMANQYQQIILNLTQQLVNPNIMNPFIDSVVKMIYPDVEWDQTLPGMGTFHLPSTEDLNPGGAENTTSNPIFGPGFRTNWTDVPQTFESSLNGPTNSTTTESVKGFIAKKSANVLAFYNK